MALVPDSARFSAAVIGKDVLPERLFVGLNVLLYGRLLLKQRYGFPTVSVRIGPGIWKKIRFNELDIHSPEKYTLPSTPTRKETL